MRDLFKKTKQIFIAALVFIFVLSLAAPAMADVGIGISAQMTAGDNHENLLYGNAKGSAYGNLLKLQLNGAGTDKFIVDRSGNVTATGQITLQGGTPGVGKVLTSDANGLGTWTAPAGGSIPAAGTAGRTLYDNGTAWTASTNIYNNGGNVGIGTIAPGAKLEVAGAGPLAEVRINANTTNNNEPRLTLYSAYTTSAAERNWGMVTSNSQVGDFVIRQSNAIGGDPILAGTSRLYIDPSGNVGIGTTGPGYKLDVSGDIRATGNLYGSAGYSSSYTKSNATNWGYYMNTTVSVAGSHIVQVYMNGNNSIWKGTFLVQGELSYTPNELWNNAKLVSWSGYNASVDDVQVWVMSNTATNGYGGAYIVIKSNAIAGGAAANMTVTITGQNAPNMSLSNSSGAPYTYTMTTSANTYQIYQSSSGNVGIGVTSPVSKLDVVSGQTLTVDYINGHSSAGLVFNAPGTTGGLAYQWQYGAATKMVMDTSGNVAIGKTSPQTNLDVNGNIAVYNELDEVATNGNAGLYLNHRGYAGGSTQFRDLYIRNGKGGDVMFVQGSTARVGIGTTAPGAKLDVVGLIRNSAPSAGTVELSGLLPGYADNTYPTLKTSGSDLYFSTRGFYSGYLDEDASGNSLFQISGAGVNWNKIMINTNGNSYFNGGNVGIGTTGPVSPLEVVGNTNWASGWRYGITATSNDYPTFRLRSLGSGKISSIGNDNDGGLYFNVNGSDSVYGTQAMEILPGGNVSIGTSNTNGRLDVENNNGVSIYSYNVGGYGVWSIGGQTGVYGQGSTYGLSGSGPTAVYGQGSSIGVQGSGPTGVYGAGNTYGVYGTGNSSGWAGYFVGSSGTASGIYVQGGTYAGYFVGGSGNNAKAVYIQGNGTKAAMGVPASLYVDNNSSGGYAAIFNGDVSIGGNLTKSGGSFLIDDPLDPQNKNLQHSFVESPEMRNVYYGQADTVNGEVEITLPEWWSALNGTNQAEYNYQFTPMGKWCSLYVAKEIANNKFTVGTKDGNCKFSWTVSAIRHDAFAEQNRIPVVTEKKPENKGKCIYPEACK